MTGSIAAIGAAARNRRKNPPAGRPPTRSRPASPVNSGRAKHNPRAAVLYHRVSTRDQDPKLARGELRRAARARGLQVVASIEETGSGARNDRPGLRRVLELAAGGAVAWVLVWKLDRLGRSMVDILNNVEELNRAGATFVCTSQGLEAGPRGGIVSRLTLAVLAAGAELERENIGERTLLGLAAAAKRGRYPGRPPGSKDTYKRRRRWAVAP